MIEFSVVMCTCDKYSCLWDPCLHLLKKYWPEYNKPIYWNSDSDNEYKSDLYSIITIKNASVSDDWSMRLYNAINAVPDDYVMLILDDYFLKSKVDNDILCKLLSQVENKKNFAGIIFVPEPPRNHPCHIDGYERRGRFSTYRISTQISVWKKDYLLKVLRKHESAWEFEICGSFRSSFLYGKNIYSQIRNKEDKYLFDYDWGLLMHRGSFNPKAKQYFEEHENIQFPDLPIKLQEKKKSRLSGKVKFAWKCFISIFKPRIREKKKHEKK